MQNMSMDIAEWKGGGCARRLDPGKRDPAGLALREGSVSCLVKKLTKDGFARIFR